jgi:hypothetical protein
VNHTDLLRRAAARVEERARLVSGTLWTAAHESMIDGSSGWRIASIGAGDFGDQNDLDWAAMLGPQIAGPLAAWLRAEADRLDTTAEIYGPDAFIPVVPAAVPVARVILGEVPT